MSVAMINLDKVFYYDDPSHHLQAILSFRADVLNGIEALIKGQQGAALLEKIGPEIDGSASLTASLSFLELAQKIYKLRRRREELFQGYDFFGEPGWDILLDLYISIESGRKVSVTSVCIASAVPATTALRWLKELEKNGMLERQTDITDARRSFIKISQKGRDLMTEYFKLYGESFRR